MPLPGLCGNFARAAVSNSPRRAPHQFRETRCPDKPDCRQTQLRACVPARQEEGAFMRPELRSAETESETPLTSLDRCLIDADAAANSSVRRLRRKALGISFLIESAALALLMIAPLWSSIAQPNFSKPTFVPFLFGAHHVHGTRVQRPAPSILPGKHSVSFFGIHVPQPRPQTMGDTASSMSSDEGWDLVPPGHEGLSVGNLSIGNALPPPSEIRRPDEKRPTKVSEGVEQAQ